GTASSFLQYIRFERAAFCEDQGHRKALAEEMAITPTNPIFLPGEPVDEPPRSPAESPRVHALSLEFEMPESDVLDLIATARRLKMAVRGWVAEEKLRKTLSDVKGVTDCVRVDQEGGPDLRLRYEGSQPLTVQCKNVLRDKAADGKIRMDLQR